MFASKQVDRPPRFLFFSFARRGCKSWLQMAKSRLLPCCVYAAHWHCQWQKIKWVLAFKQVDHPAHCPAQVSLSAFLPPPPVLIKPRKGSTSLPPQRHPPLWHLSLSLEGATYTPATFASSCFCLQRPPGGQGWICQPVQTSKIWPPRGNMFPPQEVLVVMLQLWLYSDKAKPCWFIVSHDWVRTAQCCIFGSNQIKLNQINLYFKLAFWGAELICSCMWLSEYRV